MTAIAALPFLPDAVIFDMDGLMIDSERVSVACWTQAAHELALPLADEAQVIGIDEGQFLGAELPRGAHCPSCNIDYDRDFEKNVELSFAPAPAVRPIMAGGFCLSGPMATPHVAVQLLLAAGERRDVLRRADNGLGFKIAKRTILLDQSTLLSNNLSIFF